MPRLALYGKPGAGKTTFSGFLAEAVTAKGLNSVQIKLGAPLYELQAIIYSMAGKPMLSADQQDGLLLNDLGAHLRRINPGALTEMFARRVNRAAREFPEAPIICDDMRAPDVDAVRALGFQLIHISAPEALRRLRKGARGDVTAGSETHITEVPVQVPPEYNIDNSHDLKRLRESAEELLAQVLR